LGSAYDFESMMHYGKGYFAKSSGLVTIRTKDPKYQNVIGQRNGFSKGILYKRRDPSIVPLYTVCRSVFWQYGTVYSVPN